MITAIRLIVAIANDIMVRPRKEDLAPPDCGDGRP